MRLGQAVIAFFATPTMKKYQLAGGQLVAKQGPKTGATMGMFASGEAKIKDPCYVDYEWFRIDK